VLFGVDPVSQRVLLYALNEEYCVAISLLIAFVCQRQNMVTKGMFSFCIVETLLGVNFPQAKVFLVGELSEKIAV